jgi:hypothetical protein
MITDPEQGGQKHPDPVENDNGPGSVQNNNGSGAVQNNNSSGFGWPKNNDPYPYKILTDPDPQHCLRIFKFIAGCLQDMRCPDRHRSVRLHQVDQLHPDPLQAAGDQHQACQVLIYMELPSPSAVVSRRDGYLPI